MLGFTIVLWKRSSLSFHPPSGARSTRGFDLRAWSVFLCSSTRSFEQKTACSQNIIKELFLTLNLLFLLLFDISFDMLQMQTEQAKLVKTGENQNWKRKLIRNSAIIAYVIGVHVIGYLLSNYILLSYTNSCKCTSIASQQVNVQFKVK